MPTDTRRHAGPRHARRDDGRVVRTNAIFPRTRLLLVRLAALVAVDARPMSYLAHIGAGSSKPA